MVQLFEEEGLKLFLVFLLLLFIVIIIIIIRTNRIVDVIISRDRRVYIYRRNAIGRILGMKRNARHPCVIPPLCLGLFRPLESEMERGEPQNEDDVRCIIEYHILRATDAKTTTLYSIDPFPLCLIAHRFLNNGEREREREEQRPLSPRINDISTIYIYIYI